MTVFCVFPRRVFQKRNTFQLWIFQVNGGSTVLAPPISSLLPTWICCMHLFSPNTMYPSFPLSPLPQVQNNAFQTCQVCTVDTSDDSSMPPQGGKISPLADLAPRYIGIWLLLPLPGDGRRKGCFEYATFYFNLIKDVPAFSLPRFLALGGQWLTGIQHGGK